MRYYLDTSIWIDFYDKRGENGEIAKQVIQKIIMNDETIIYSDITIVELKKLGYSGTEIYEMMRVAKPTHIKRVHPTKEQFIEATRLAKQRNVPLGDALHAILAQNSDAYLISRDKHFNVLKDVIKTFPPEKLI